eukprot:scaffold813_cov313-Prasinococcus_capsulatus_cf.AAC.6
MEVPKVLTTCTEAGTAPHTQLLPSTSTVTLSSFTKNPSTSASETSCSLRPPTKGGGGEDSTAPAILGEAGHCSGELVVVRAQRLQVGELLEDLDAPVEVVVAQVDLLEQLQRREGVRDAPVQVVVVQVHAPQFGHRTQHRHLAYELVDAQIEKLQVLQVGQRRR